MKYAYILLGIIFFLVFRNWFITPEIIGGDWPYLFSPQVQEIGFIPTLWSPIYGVGMGGVIPGYPLHLYFSSTAYISTQLLHIPWLLSARIFWFGLYIIVSAVSSIYFLRVILGRSSVFQNIIAACIYTTNTYILMIVGGGQMGIALSYAIAPLVLGRLIKNIDLIRLSRKNFKFQISNFKLPIYASIIFSLQVLFDPRIAYITMLAAFLYLVLRIEYRVSRKNIRYTLYTILYTFVVPVVITLLLLSFWILPLVVSNINPLTVSKISPVSAGILKFFSFGQFSQALSLLHPNWPENIFGKTYFMRWEFLVLPVIAYGFLLGIGNSLKGADRNAEKRRILYLGLVGLLGAFLAKGASEPFGEVYIWLFQHVPGFSLFRDPTKWYILVAMAYSVLIPWSLAEFGRFLSSRRSRKAGEERSSAKNYTQRISLPINQDRNDKLIGTVFILYWLILIAPAILGNLGGTFKMRNVPIEYVKLKDFLHEQPDFFRTIWVPKYQRLGFYSNNHPAIDGQDFFTVGSSPSALLKQLRRPEAEKQLQQAGVKYVIVPYDTDSEIFLTDRKYDDKQYQKILDQLKAIKWLTPRVSFGKLVVFETKDHSDRFRLEDNNSEVNWHMVSPVHYEVQLKNSSSSGKLVFAEAFDPNWEIHTRGTVITPEKYEAGLNSFQLRKGMQQFDVVYTPQMWVNIGLVVSMVVLVGILWFIHL